MNNLREAAQMALDVLELVDGYVMGKHEAKEALYEALAQPEQEPVAFLADATRFKVTLTQDDCKITNLPRELGGRWVALVAAENDCHMKLTAPPQREWQGLTQEEVRRIVQSNTDPWCDTPETDGYGVAEMVEFKLREKNGNF